MGYSAAVFLEQRPDLILCKNNVAGMAKEHIGDIAPVVSIDWTSMDVYSHAETIARLLGKEEAFSAWHAAHNKKVREARASVENRIGTGRSAAIWSVTNKGVRMYGARNMGHVFYRLLGFRAPEYIQEKIEEHPMGTMFTWMPASLELMKRDRSDFMWIVTDSDHRRRMMEHEIKMDPLLSAHPAVQNGRCFFLDWQKWSVYAPLGIEKQLEEAVFCLRSYEN
ncbi:ABC transporter substrate-binding protein [Domibacillus sp. 8LH]|uniref:ABC transporter substrate-binding protein n=1 Tax=Domibacillus sp. 8LH TaxID=3073900 RepID=UPI003173DB13